MSEELLLAGLRVAGALHFVTLGLAWFTPIPRDWDSGLAALSPVHRRFALAQNVAVGAVLVFFGHVALFHAPVLLDGSPGGGLLATGAALWWGGRLFVLPWLRVGGELRSAWLRAGWVLLHVQCALQAALFGWLALR